MTTTHTIRDRGQKVAAESRIARLEDRYRNDLMGVEERDELRSRIARLKRKAGAR